jgi:hypothetical protein
MSRNPVSLFSDLARSVERSDRTVSATIVEDEVFLEIFLEEIDKDGCDRCADRRNPIVGIILFRQPSEDDRQLWGKTTWLVCASCLAELKIRGASLSNN